MVTINVYEGSERGGGWGRGQRGRQRGGRGAGRRNHLGPPHPPRGGRGGGRPRGQGARQRQQQQNQNVQQGQAGQPMMGPVRNPQQQQHNMIRNPGGAGSQNVEMGHQHGMPHPQMQQRHPQQMMNAQNQQPWMRQQQQQMLMRQQQGPPQQSLGNNGAQPQGAPQFLAYSQGNQMGFGRGPARNGQRYFNRRRPYRGRWVVPNPAFTVPRVSTGTEEADRAVLQAKERELDWKSRVHPEIMAKLEEAFGKLQAATDEQCHSLLKKHLTREVFDNIKGRKTALGATLLDVIQSGVENLDSGVGVYAPDAESYAVFAELFDPIIEEYHKGFPVDAMQPARDFGDLNTLMNLDPEGQYVISTQVQCGRSIEGYPFNPCLTEEQYKEMESKVSTILSSLQGELHGSYYPLAGMTKEVQQRLIDDHFLFKEGDRFLQSANAFRFWPSGRGIFHNEAKTFLVWVNKDDHHLRIISMQQGGKLASVYLRMVGGVSEIEQQLPFSRSDLFGYLTFCPTNLGKTFRASVHIKLPKLSADKVNFEAIAAQYNLQVRGTSGEQSDNPDGVYDISNKRRLGLTEYQAVMEVQNGIMEMIKIEKGIP